MLRRPGSGRLPVPTEGSFTSRLRSAAVTARVGLWLGVCFAVAFVTGLLSHYAQLDHQPVPLPTRPVWGYQVTQGLHVVAGTAAVPLLLVKLWTVYPRLFAAVPRRAREILPATLERGSIAVLVAAAVFELATGVANVAQWYVWDFSFRRSHYAVGWIAIGALLVHVAVKLPVVRSALAADVDDTANDRPTAVRPGPLSRRGLLRGTWFAAAAVAVVSAGSSVPGVRRLAVLAPREIRAGEIPINGPASGAGVVAAATAASYRCRVRAGDREALLTRARLQAMQQRTVDLPIACVEGWSASGSWTGVRLRDLLDLVGAERGAEVVVTSLQQSHSTVLPPSFADDDETLLALALNGDPLSIDHGFPARLIAPNRPGVEQVKWVDRIEVLS